ncbi:MAG TPA: HD domain-containing protein [Sphingomicrobium sp.]|nr:HD domain-containing protein [Sphingomicrobium sp.]
MNDQRAGFTAMKEGTAADWALIASHFMSFNQGLPDRVLTHLKLLEGDYGGFPIDRLQHSLQTATRAHRGGESEPYVVMALLHDIGDTLASYNHPDIAAAILKPFVDEKLHWMCQNHGVFQGYYFFHYLGMDRDMREAFRGHAHFEDTARFCELYDQSSFDPAYDTAPLEFFEPMVRRLFERPLNSLYKGVGEAA